ncbi:MAG: hypothetical protein PHV43_02060 [Candidatus Colwellbacteria bacterium]|nr:hypothetical protein [Candidatus Colwellbacteria bacterium]
MRNNRLLWLCAGAAVLLTIILRLLPHAPNFTPVGALFLFAGAFLPGRLKFIVPIIALGVSDFFIGFYDYKLMFVVYGSFLMMSVLGSLAGRKVSPLRIGLGSLGGSTFFFFATNFAVWIFSDWYAPTLGGLLSAYIMGIPFFRMTLLGDLFFSTLFFGAYETVKIARLYRLGYTLPVRVRIGIGDTALLEKKVR